VKPKQDEVGDRNLCKEAQLATSEDAARAWSIHSYDRVYPLWGRCSFARIGEQSAPPGA
jgi:hypothetical protein